MCLAVIALRAHPRYALVVAANRDERHARPTANAQWWPEGWLGGRDLQAHGTWFGVDRRGRFAFVTNVREPQRNDPLAPSRGTIVPAILANLNDVDVAVTHAASDTARNGFNVIAGDASSAWWASNRLQAPGAVAIPSGVAGISNAALDTPWPKLTRTKARVRAWCSSGDAALDSLFATLRDRTRPPDAELPATGVSEEWERLLASPFIVSDAYGTRSSTVLAITRDGDAQFIEQSFDACGEPTLRVELHFQVAITTAAPG